MSGQWARIRSRSTRSRAIAFSGPSSASGAPDRVTPREPLVGGAEPGAAHDGSLDLACTQQRILKILRIAGRTEVFGIYEMADQAIAAAGGEQQRNGQWR